MPAERLADWRKTIDKIKKWQLKPIKGTVGSRTNDEVQLIKLELNRSRNKSESVEETSSAIKGTGWQDRIQIDGNN